MGGELERDMDWANWAQSLLLQVELADAQPISEDMGVVVLETGSAAKSPYRRLTDTQDSPELVLLRKFIAGFPSR